MSESAVLFQLTTKGLSLVHQGILEITEQGLHYTNKGIGSALNKENLFIPYNEVAAINVEKILMGIQYNFSITSTSGKILKMENVHKEQATKAKAIIQDNQMKFMRKTARNNETGTMNHQPVDLADQILKLSKLRDDGILTQEQFETQKQKLLNL